MNFTPPLATIVAVSLVAITAASAALAQAEDTASPHLRSDGLNPQQIGLSVQLGYQSNLGRGEKSKSYYRLEYRGQQLTERGEAPSPTSIGKPLEVPSLTAPAGDTNTYRLTVDNAGARSDSGIFNLLGVQKIPISGLKQMRGAIQYLGRLDGGTTRLSAGVETVNYHPLDLINQGGPGGIGAGLTNWLVLGYYQDTVSRSSTDGGNKNNGQATYRAFVGRGFGWRNSSRLQSAVREYVLSAVPQTSTGFNAAVNQATQNQASGHASVVDRILINLASNALNSRVQPILTTLDDANADAPTKNKARQDYRGLVDESIKLSDVSSDDRAVEIAPTFQKAKGIFDQQSSAPGTLTGLEAVIAFAYLRIKGNPPASDAEWQQKLRNAVRRYQGLADQPSFALWGESSGWYTATGPLDTRSRFNAIYALTATYWFNPASLNNYFFNTRYENGRERADPTTYRHLWSASLGYNF